MTSPDRSRVMRSRSNPVGDEVGRELPPEPGLRRDGTTVHSDDGEQDFGTHRGSRLETREPPTKETLSR